MIFFCGKISYFSLQSLKNYRTTQAFFAHFAYILYITYITVTQDNGMLQHHLHRNDTVYEDETFLPAVLHLC